MQATRGTVTYNLALSLWALSTGLAIFHYPVALVGDGYEFAVMLTAISRHATPGITPEDVAAYNALIAEKPLPDTGPVKPSYDPWIEVPGSGGKLWDMRHFWFYSLLAMPFLPLARVLGLHPMAAFVLLHAALCLATIWIARRWSGPPGALAAAIVLVGSPVFWYSNKAHTEVLTVCTVLVALIGAASGRAAWAGLALATGAAQNGLLAPLSAGMLLWAWFGDRESRRQTVAIAAVSAFLIAQAPVYYWFRHGFTNPLVDIGYVQPALFGFKRILTLWVDPDRGLLTLWPLAVPVVVASAAGIHRLKLANPALWLGLAYPLICQPVLAMQVNWNPGASHLVHRYAVWFVPLAWFGLKRWIEFAAGSERIGRGLTGVALVVCVAWCAFGQRPAQPDTVARFNGLSRWFYASLPGLYDPDPEVFLERACAAEMGGYLRPLRRVDRSRLHCLGGVASERGFWAAADPSCTKIYISSAGLEEQLARPAPTPVAGCQFERNPATLLQIARRRKPANGADFYLTWR